MEDSDTYHMEDSDTYHMEDSDTYHMEDSDTYHIIHLINNRNNQLIFLHEICLCVFNAA